jgi:hypothetical protein
VPGEGVVTRIPGRDKTGARRQPRRHDLDAKPSVGEQLLLDEGGLTGRERRVDRARGGGEVDALR